MKKDSRAYMSEDEEEGVYKTFQNQEKYGCSLLEKYGFGYVQQIRNYNYKSTNKRKRSRSRSNSPPVTKKQKLEEDFGPQIPAQLLEKECEDENLLTTSYRRPKRFKNPTEELHPLDEKRILGQIKLKENQKREEEIQKYMRSLLKK